MNGYGNILVAQLLIGAGLSLEHAGAVISREELDVLDWAAHTAESVMFDRPDGHGDDYRRGWMDGAAAVEARLVTEAERARIEAEHGDIPVPPAAPSLTTAQADQADQRVAARRGALARVLAPLAAPAEPLVPLDGDGEPVTLAVHRVEGVPMIPADQVTALVRGLAEQFAAWRRGGAPLDLLTTARLCTVLTDYADDLDTGLGTAAESPILP